MHTLTIKDLARSEQLDRAAMFTVRGGMNEWCGTAPSYCEPSYCYQPTNYSPVSDSSLHATQNLAQYQNAVNSVADGSAYLSGMSVTNTNSQFGQNNIYVC